MVLFCNETLSIKIQVKNTLSFSGKGLKGLYYFHFIRHPLFFKFLAIETRRFFEKPNSELMNAL